MTPEQSAMFDALLGAEGRAMRDALNVKRRAAWAQTVIDASPAPMIDVPFTPTREEMLAFLERRRPAPNFKMPWDPGLIEFTGYTIRHHSTIVDYFTIPIT